MSFVPIIRDTPLSFTQLMVFHGLFTRASIFFSTALKYYRLYIHRQHIMFINTTFYESES